MDKLIRKISSSLLALLLVLQNCTGLVYASQNLDGEVNSKSVVDLNYEDSSKDDPTLETPSDSEVWVEPIEDDTVHNDEDLLESNNEDPPSDLDDNYKAMGDSLNKGEGIIVSLPNTSYKPSDKLDISGIEILLKDENGKLNLLTDDDLLSSDYITISPRSGESLQGFYYKKLFDSDFLKNESDELKSEIDDYLRENNIKEQEEKVRIDIPGIESLEFDLQISDDDLDLSPMELFRALKMSKNSMALLTFDKFTLTKDEDLSYDNLRVLAKDSEGGLQILGKDELEIEDEEFLKEKEDFKKNAKENDPPRDTYIEVKNKAYDSLYLPISIVFDKNQILNYNNQDSVDLYGYGVKVDKDETIFTLGLDIKDLSDTREVNIEILDKDKEKSNNLTIDRIVKTNGKNEEDLSLTDGRYRGIDDKDLAKAADYEIQNPIKLSEDLSAGNKYVIFIKAKEDAIYTRIKSKGLHNTSDKEIKLGAKELTHTTTLKGEEEKTPTDNKEDLDKPSEADPENLAKEEVSPENQEQAEKTLPEVNQAEPTAPSLEENKPAMARLNNPLLATSNLEGSTSEKPTEQILGSERLKQLSLDRQNSATLTQANPTLSSESQATEALATNRGLFLNLLATNGGRKLDINNSDIRVENVVYEIKQEGDPYYYGPSGKSGLSVNPPTGAAMEVHLDIVFNGLVGAGDYFYFQAANGIDTRGILTDENRGFDINDRDSGRKIAVLRDEPGTRDTEKITFVGDFDSPKIHLDMVIYPDRYQITSSGDVTPTLMVAGKEVTLDRTYYNYPNPDDKYPSRSFGIINKYNRESQEFEALIYANPNRGATNTSYPLSNPIFEVFNSPATNKYSYLSPTADIKNIEIYAVPASEKLPEGIAVDDAFLRENNATLLYDGLPSKNSKSGSYSVPINRSGNDQLVIRVKGKHLDGLTNLKKLDIKYNFYNGGVPTTWNMVKGTLPSGGSGEIREPDVPPVTPPETPPSEEKTGGFTITKKSTDGTILQGASFVLQELDGTYNKELTTNSQGKVTFDNLKPGSYTLTESKAPEGYTGKTASETITVDEDGKVTWTNKGLIDTKYEADEVEEPSYVEPFKTQLIQGQDPYYPDYMNYMFYTELTDPQSGKLTYWLMLKPQRNGNGNGTNKNTRLNIRGENIDLQGTEFKIFDVDPDNRDAIVSRFKNQSLTYDYLKGIEKDLSRPDQGGSITYRNNAYDSHLNKYVDLQIKFPSARFGGDWGYVIKVDGKVDDLTQPSKIILDWLTDINNPDNEASIRNQVSEIGLIQTGGASSSGKAKENPTLDVTNEPIPVEVYGKLTINKKDNKDKSLLEGAKFLLQSINSDWSQEGTTDQDGKLTFDQIPKGEYILSETQAPSGYKQSPTKWKVYVNSKGQTFVYEMGDINQPDTGGSNETPSNLGQDVSSKIQIKSSSMTYNNKDSNTSIDLYTDENQININLNMAVDGKVSPGDYFVIEESDTLHYNMAQYDKPTYTPIVDSSTDEIIAIPQFSVDNWEKSTGKKITYVFTDYVEGLDNLTMSLDWEHAVNPNAAKYDGAYEFKLKIGKSSVSKTFNVKYQDPVVKGHVSIDAVYPYVNDQIGKYTQYAYINPLKNNLSGRSTISVYTAKRSNNDNSADLGATKTDIKLYKYISNETLPDAIIYEEGKWQEVDPSTYNVRFGSRTNEEDGSVQTYAEFDVNDINTDTYLVKVDSELKDTTADQPIVGQFVQVTNDGVSANKGNAIVRMGSSGQGQGDLQDRPIDIYNEKEEKVPMKIKLKKLDGDYNEINSGTVKLRMQAVDNTFPDNIKDSWNFVESISTDRKSVILSLDLSKNTEFELNVPKNLNSGRYIITEEEAPDGYVKTNKEYILDIDQEKGSISYVQNSYNTSEDKLHDGDKNIDIEDLNQNADIRTWYCLNYHLKLPNGKISYNMSESQINDLIQNQSSDVEMKIKQILYYVNEYLTEEQRTDKFNYYNKISGLAVNNPDNDYNIVQNAIWYYTDNLKLNENNKKGAIELVTDVKAAVDKGEITEEDYNKINLYYYEPENKDYQNVVTFTIDKDNEKTVNINIVNNKEVKTSLKIIKQNDENTRLPGAVFELYQIEEGKEDKKVVLDEKESWTTGDDGTITIEGLVDGTYYLKETKEPKGYIPTKAEIGPIVIKDGKIIVDNEANENEDLFTLAYNEKDGNTVTVINHKAVYPATGGWGSFIYTMLGLMLASVAILGAKKREVID